MRSTIPRLTPDGKPQRPRRAADETDRSKVATSEDPKLTGDANGGTHTNTDEARPNADGLVRRGDDRDAPII